jgi:predicted molibdopterin-dependent oxidoreductase YjgC
LKQEHTSPRPKLDQLDVINEVNLNIRIDQTEYPVRAGISVAAALIENDISVFQHSDEGGSRALFCGMGVCYDCLVTIDGIPDQRACTTLVRDGMHVQTGRVSHEAG